MKQVQIGDTVLFGKYEQDNDLSNGPEDIEWIVLDKKGNKAFLISKYALDCQQYSNIEDSTATWETCSLRKWLNNDFLNSAFSADEQKSIQVSSVSADKNPRYPANPGNATQDRVFLLSIPEAYEYFVSVSVRVCKPTAYAAASGTLGSDEEGCLWWLRSPGVTQNGAAYVGGGYVLEYGLSVNGGNAVRPALWINLEGPAGTFADRSEKSAPARSTETVLSADKVETEKLRPLKQVQIGDTVLFGKYEQDNDLSNGPEDIEWIVLDKEGNRALLISKYALDCKPYDMKYIDETWEACSLRRWLNNDFLNTAFSVKEQAMIPVSYVFADENPNHSTNPGNATQDRIFLLSIPEANKYFASDSARECKPTAYAIAIGAWIGGYSESCWWWLRPFGDYRDDSFCVSYDGDVCAYDCNATYEFGAVRPALWINLES